MKQFTIQQKQVLAGNVLLLTLQAQDPSQILSFDAGQYVTVGFKRNGRRTPVRPFSIVSSPNDTLSLQVAMRVQGNFTRTVHQLSVGDKAYVQGPFGDFTINPNYDRRIVMLAGGIGITPFMSMLRWANETQLAVPITLLYSCRSRADVSFYDEIMALQQQNPNFRAMFFITGEAAASESDNKFVDSAINDEHLERLVAGEFQGVTYFTCGPQGFMNSMEQLLLRRDVSPDRIITESFAQSSKLGLPKAWSPQALTYAFASLLLLGGVGAIMLLDLVHSVPKLAASQSSTSTTTTSDQVPTNNSSDQTSNSQSTSNQNTNNYSQPVSSVS